MKKMVALAVGIGLAGVAAYCVIAHELGSYPSFSDIISDEWEEDYF